MTAVGSGLPNLHSMLGDQDRQYCWEQTPIGCRLVRVIGAWPRTNDILKVA